MLLQTSQGQSGSAHVVVLGNEKGGTGKSTVALHVAVALLKAGQRVATIDLDCRQQGFTRYINNRRAWARRTGLGLELPILRFIKSGETMQILDNESSELVLFVDAVSTVERTFDSIVIDTPGSDTHLMRLAHVMADTLVTPINDSFPRFRRPGDCGRRDPFRDRRELLCRNGAGGATQTPTAWRRQYRLGRSAQPPGDT